MSDPDRAPELRASHADRDAVAERLREAAGDGRIDLDELDERLEAAYAARTHADLVRLTADLPDPSAARGPARPGGSTVVPLAEGAGRRSRHLAIMSGIERKGVWTMPPELTVTCWMGGADLDLREARFGAREVVLRVNAFMGGATVTVGPDVVVLMEGTGIMGGFSAAGEPDADDLTPDSPVLRIRGVAIWGGVSVERKPRRDDGDELPPGRKPPALP